MISFVRCDSHNEDFLELVRCLDANLFARNGAIQNEYASHNVIEFIETVIIAKEDDLAVVAAAFASMMKLLSRSSVCSCVLNIGGRA